MRTFVLLALGSLVRDWHVLSFLRETFSVCYPGVGSAYHLSQAIADSRKLGEDKPFTAIIVEARDFCNFLNMFHLYFWSDQRQRTGSGATGSFVK
jgi:hypothetical protein